MFFYPLLNSLFIILKREIKIMFFVPRYDQKIYLLIIQISELSIFYVVLILNLVLNKRRHRYSYENNISEFYLLDISEVCRKLLWRLNENRSSIYSLFLIFRHYYLNRVVLVSLIPKLSLSYQQFLVIFASKNISSHHYYF